MRPLADFTLEQDAAGTSILSLRGAYLVSTVGTVDAALRAIDGPVQRLDLSQVSAIDTVGAWIAWRIIRDSGAAVTGQSEEAHRLIESVSASSGTALIAPPQVPVLERVPARVGEAMYNSRAGLIGLLGFLGAMLISFGDLIRHPSRFRGKALVHQIELVGVNSLGIIGLMSFLVGIVIAQQGAVQLQQFGAEMLTVNLTGRIAMRELGVLMTAIMVAGRSGSAFAAQIGTMKLTEEVDAMRTIGVSPMEALVVPRVVAAFLMMPLLGFYAALMAICGGAFVSAFTLGIPFLTFLSRIQEVVPIHDLWVGLVKGPVFGFIVAIAGCYQGMLVQGNAEEVGLRTTQAVVQAIFAVIVLDAFFAVFFTELGWG
ncbi:MAG: ABC transporter permease [Sphingomonadales bacterium]|nr:ABC transporter permease [Sphingomonadales bacterium]